MLAFKAYSDPIYLDYQASTPVDPKVLEKMLSYFDKEYGNPHSTTHVYGIRARQAIEKARDEIATVINADAKEIIFTSGATEANNIAILGACRALKKQGKSEVISVSTEHKSVLEPIRALEEEGFKVILLPVHKDGLIDLSLLEKTLSSKTALVSIMAANNEIGVLQPIKEIANLAHKSGALFHTDAAQAFGKIPLDVKDIDIDLLSISGHKIYGPKGVGALFIKKNLHILPISYGGDQEKGLRPGTLPTPLCVGLGVASQLSQAELVSESKRILALRNKFLKLLEESHIDVIINGHLEQRLPGNLNLSFKGIDSKSLLSNLKGIAVSIGSACSCSSGEFSHVIRAIDPSDASNPAILRLSIGRFTTEEEIEKVAKEIIMSIGRLKEKPNERIY